MRKKQLPYVAVPLSDENFIENLEKAFFKGADIIELRVDMFEDRSIENIKSMLREIKARDLMSILTIRAKWEGGATEIDDAEREEIIKSCIDLVDYIDIELSSHDLIDRTKDIIKENGKELIISYHDFEKTPSNEVIQRIIDKSIKYGADIVKYAFYITTHEDVGRLLSITYDYYKRGKKLIAIGMGELGKITRVAGYFFGSRITYTFIGSAVAPGQINIDKLEEELRFYAIKD
jgi:3-dehydroquinate dehydratase-1